MPSLVSGATEARRCNSSWEHRSCQAAPGNPRFQQQRLLFLLSQASNEEAKRDLRSRGLCLVPLSCTSYMTTRSAATYRGGEVIEYVLTHFHRGVSELVIPALGRLRNERRTFFYLSQGHPVWTYNGDIYNTDKGRATSSPGQADSDTQEQYEWF
ncbi:hypothetical protein B296_00044467 [Ensete ventricosum]|uniref:Uncharacterized protein n=1 Tax=Ensete ventricosum TaxID=4639 RepID=A0A426XC76_ENSVE|nr:hypothetical protein B296_00044467 [Ensete ventricosum]